jgi:hypothetical protein
MLLSNLRKVNDTYKLQVVAIGKRYNKKQEQDLGQIDMGMSAVDSN